MPTKMAKPTNSRFDILRLYPLTEESLTEMSSAIVNILLASEEIISRSDRRRSDTMKLLRQMVQFSSCKAPTLLTRVTCIESIYKNENIDCVQIVQSLKDISDLALLGRAIMNSLLSTELKNNILREITSKLYREGSDEAHTFLCELWANRDSVPLTQDFTEEITLHFPFCIEQFLLGLAEQVVQVHNEELLKETLNEEHLQSFCNLCSKSSQIFLMTVTILHQILLISNMHRNVMILIKEILIKIKSVCQTCQFMELFPFEQRILISYLEIPPELYPEDFPDKEFTKESALNKLTSYLLVQRRVSTALLSYFPEWLPYILDYCCQNNIVSLIPPNRGRETPENYLKFLSASKYCFSESYS